MAKPKAADPELLQFESDGLVAELRFNQPDKRNPLDLATLGQFKKALGVIKKDKAKVLIITGAGTAFSAGGDIAFLEGNTRKSSPVVRAIMESFYKSFLELRKVPQLTIAQINGAAVGAGLCLAMACDMRTALADAKLAFNFVKLGLSPGMGAWVWAERVLGPARAMELLATGRFFTGRDLFLWNAACRVAPSADELQKQTRELAQEIATGGRLALRLLKDESHLGVDERLKKHLAFEARAQAICFASDEMKEGLRALTEKRAPRFK